MPKKLYLHYEGTPDFTYIAQVEAGTTVAALAASFATAYASAHPAAGLTGLVLTNDDGLPLADADLEDLDAGDDVLIEAEVSKPQTSQQSPALSPSAPSASVSPAASTSARHTAAAAVAQAAASSSSQAANMSTAVEVVSRSLTTAQALTAKKAYRRAIEVYEQIIAAMPQLPQPYIGMAQILIAIRDFAAATNIADRGLAMLAESPPLLAAIGLDVAQARISLLRLKASALGDAKKYKKAIAVFTDALELADKSDKAADALDIQVAIGEVLYASGEEDAGITLFQNVLKINESHFDGLYNFAIACGDRGRPLEALSVFLKLLVAEQKHKGVRARITDIVMADGGMDLLDAAIQDAAKSPAALAFLGLLIKENSALDSSVALYERALAGAPDSASYVLNLVHGYEICAQYGQAWAAAMKFCAANSALGVGGLTCARVLKALGGLSSPIGLPTASAFLPDSDIVAAAGCSYDPTLPYNTLELVAGGTNLSDSPATAAGMLDDAELVEVIGYDARELDLLALFCTLVKILFNVGALPPTAALIPLIDEIRGTRPIHRTTIRNEHAYYCCIAQLLAYPTSVPDPEMPVVYVAGDSHSQTPAWRVVALNGTPHLLVPRLVTGLKIWHLREESRFYPKANFWRVIDTIPDGATVLTMFGEIDCREGFLVAVAKRIYETVEEAARVTVNIYIKTMLRLVNDRKLTFLVHPAVPVLNETRSVVTMFNTVLGAKLTQLNHASIKWLPFFDAMLDPADSSALNPAFELDGTHLNPTYLDVLQSGLDAALANSTS
ncbi:uncharacterized protein AMSG_08756 [Thecamonas trahens ATCC 50062]|uniref:Uncharacterized protein n=1 Tax=Thecamonas trahens ATCC 50062 TaxID=461836 RepID=A0A0L0DML4_THETB|nr:hypothetical protein AMSG_08756 [Thecamonas trahens ATCC 50062]KNC53266.1 hypothetical protein AMSG_08756 [Thecamonas trahens ATCC 50062]|eukprot:XP_013754530.1 hypothetical protein AMSG_08756 [Thecamonas trahens ATCC 50062]